MIDVFTQKPLVIKATDADLDPNYNTVQYKFYDPKQEVQDFFEINKVSGEMFLLRNIADYPFDGISNRIDVCISQEIFFF